LRLPQQQSQGRLTSPWHPQQLKAAASPRKIGREHRLGYPDTVKRLELLAERDNVLDLVRLGLTADGPANRRISEAAPLDFHFLYPILPELLAARSHRSADRSLGNRLRGCLKTVMFGRAAWSWS